MPERNFEIAYESALVSLDSFEINFAFLVLSPQFGERPATVVRLFLCLDFDAQGYVRIGLSVYALGP